MGRNAEAAGAASLKSVAGIFAYSKTKGLFAGVSLEGSILIERQDANAKLYNRKVTARELLGGSVPPPPQADPLMRVLNSRVFAGTGGSFSNDAMYNDVPIYDDRHEDVVWQGRSGAGYGEGVRTNRTGSMGAANDNEYNYSDRGPQRSSTWQDDPYDQASNRASGFGMLNESRGQTSTFGDGDDYSYSDTKRSTAPGRPTAPKPSAFGYKGAPGPGQAIAKFAFDADQPGDLGFKKGDIITIVKRTESETDWWTGRIGDREGIFPSNYVEVV